MKKNYLISNSKPVISVNQFIFILFFFIGLCNTSGGALIYDAAWSGMTLLTLIICFMDIKCCTSICRDRKVWALIIVLIFTTVYTFPVGGLAHTLKQVIYTIFLYSPIFAFDYFKQPHNKKYLKWVLSISYGFVMLFCVYSLVFYYFNPGTARYARDYSLLIGGAYGLACEASLLSCFLFGLLINGFFDYNKKIRAGVIVSIIIMFLTVYKTESTLTFIILVVGLIGCLYFKNNNKTFFHIRLILLPIAIIACIIILPHLGEWLIEISEPKIYDNRMFKRLYSAGNFLVYGTDNTDAAYAVNRFMIPFTTLKTFLQNPIFGVGYKHGCGYLRPYLFGVGNHCEFADALANFGIFGGTAMLSIYGNQAFEIQKYNATRSSKMWMVVLILLGLFNPLRYFQVNFVLFFLIPLFCLYYQEKLNDTSQEVTKQ